MNCGNQCVEAGAVYHCSMEILLHESGLFVSNFSQFAYRLRRLNYFPKSGFSCGFDSRWASCKNVSLFCRGENKEKLRRRRQKYNINVMHAFLAFPAPMEWGRYSLSDGFSVGVFSGLEHKNWPRAGGKGRGQMRLCEMQWINLSEHFMAAFKIPASSFMRNKITCFCSNHPGPFT